MIRHALPILPKFISRKLTHSLDRPFGNRYYQDRASNYDRDREHQVSWAEEQAALTEIAVELGNGLSVLDVPVGTGRFFPLYAEMGWEPTGLDVSKEMLNVARRRSAGLFQNLPLLEKGKAHKLPFDDRRFDVVVCFRFLQSIVSFGTARRVIAEIARVTRKHVVLHLDVKPQGQPEGHLPSPNETMRGKLSWNQIENLLASEGLEIVRVIGPITHDSKNEHVVLCEKTPTLRSDLGPLRGAKNDS